MPTDTSIESLERDLFEWWDSLTEDSAVVAAPLIELVRRHQAAAWEDACNALAWAMDNGPEGSAIGYVLDNNRYDAGVWTQEEIDAILLRASARAAEIRKYVD